MSPCFSQLGLNVIRLGFGNCYGTAQPPISPVAGGGGGGGSDESDLGRGPLFHANYFALSLTIITIIFTLTVGDLRNVRVNGGPASLTLGQH